MSDCKNQPDRRLIGGPRVLSKCEVLLPKVDLFDHSTRSTKPGTVVFNTRGGCLYLQEHVFEKNINRIFPNGVSTIVKRFSLFFGENSEYTIDNIKFKYIRYNDQGQRAGLVFRFIDFTEDQLDSLEMLQKLLPKVATYMPPKPGYP